jgi:hypothetical protein
MPGGDGGTGDKGAFTSIGAGPGGNGLAMELAGSVYNTIGGNFKDSITGKDTSATAKFRVYGLRYANFDLDRTGYNCTTPDSMHIIGLLSSDGWKIYSQHNSQGILSVHQVM